MTATDVIALLALLALTAILALEHPEYGHNVVWLAGISGVVAAWVVNPLHTLLHELGHAMAAVSLTRQRVTVRLGQADGPPRFYLGRIGFLAGLPIRGGACSFDPRRVSAGRLAAVVVAGPLASGAFAAACTTLAAWALDSAPVVFLLAGYGAIIGCFGLLNLIPSYRWHAQLPGGDLEPETSDGMLLLRAVRGRRGEDLWPEALHEATLRGRTEPPEAALVTRVVGDAVRFAQAEGADGLLFGHVLRALATPGGGPAGDVLAAQGLRAELPAVPELPAPLRETATVRRLLGRAHAARTLLPGDIDERHLLLAVVQESEDLSAEDVLHAAGTTREAVRRELVGRAEARAD